MNQEWITTWKSADTHMTFYQKKITADIQNLNIYIPLRLESEAGFECSAGVFVHWQGTFRNVAPSRSYGLTRMSVPPVIQSIN